MRLDDLNGCHLTYCTNIHPGETWAEVREALLRHTTAVKKAVSPRAPFGVGLRLSARAARDLSHPSRLRELVDLLDREDLYVFTINGFPYGTFHGTRVKEGVYQPDWRSDERLAYTNLLADLLAAILPEGLEGSISTVPGAFKPNATRGGDVDAIVEHLLRHAVHLWRLEARTGRPIALAIEPEPACFLETIDQVLDFFAERVLGRDGRSRFAALAGLDDARAEAALRRHLGVCFDVCHAAVEFERCATALGRLADAGIRAPKVQLSTALRVAPVTPEAVEALGRFDEPVYLHQVIARRGGDVERYPDLPQACRAFDPDAAAEEWRIHFHVPIFLEDLGWCSSTQPALVETLAWLRQRPLAPHLEVETYTWDVLPAEHRHTDVTAAIAREIDWARRRLVP